MDHRENNVKGVVFVDELGCDYECRTVGEGIRKYNICGDWCAEFQVCDDIYPVVCIQVDQIRKNPAVMELKLRIVENEDHEYAGCMVCTERKTIAFKVDHMRDLLKVLGKE